MSMTTDNDNSESLSTPQQKNAVVMDLCGWSGKSIYVSPTTVAPKTKVTQSVFTEKSTTNDAQESQIESETSIDPKKPVTVLSDIKDQEIQMESSESNSPTPEETKVFEKKSDASESILSKDDTNIDTLLSDAKAEEAYVEWCKKYGKKPNEFRFPVFRSNYEIMIKFNAANDMEMELNKYADCTEEEYEDLMARKKEDFVVMARKKAETTTRKLYEQPEFGEWVTIHGGSQISFSDYES